MSVMSPKDLTKTITAIGKASEKFATVVQEALISCAYYAMKDGNVTPYNDLLDAVGDSTRIKGLTAWAELFSPVHIKEGRFALSKGAAKSIHVACAEDFAEFESEMRAGPRWDKIVAKETRESIWDSGKYLERVVKKLNDQGEHDLAKAIMDAELSVRIKRTKAADAPKPQEPKLLKAA